MVNKKLIIANWKMHPDSESEAVLLAKRTEKAASKSKNEVVIAPPFPFIKSIKSHVSRVKLGAQDVSLELQDAHTGEVSAEMLKDAGVEYVIIGHSDCRALGETDEMINKKIQATLKAGLKPILCVGEHTRETRDKRQGIRKAKDFVREQLKNDLKGVSILINKKSPRRSASSPRKSALLIAYEPIWAISTNKNAQPDKPEDSLEMIKFIKNFLLVTCHLSHAAVLYGGSVTSKNAKSFLQYKEIDGALVGGASLNANEFGKIIQST